MNYYLTYDEHSYVITEPEDSDEPFSDQGETGVDVTLRAIHRSPVKGGHELVSDEGGYSRLYGVEDVPAGETAYVVLVNYSDGDTFGSSGYWTIAAVCSNPQSAKNIVERCEGENDLSHRAYRPWDGYFAHLNSAEVVPMTVLA